MGAVAVMNEMKPHEHFSSGRKGPKAASLRRVWLFMIAITIHIAPEGLTVGMAFGADGFTGGVPVALGIGLQNAPEGIAVAVADVAAAIAYIAPEEAGFVNVAALGNTGGQAMVI